MGSIGRTSNSNEYAGTYELYRAGNLEAPNGMIFLTTSPEEAAQYAFSGTKTKVESGGYISEMHKSIEQYSLNIKNPLVVDEGTDRNNIIKAWQILHPGEDAKIKTSGLPAKQWQRMDKQNAKALENSPYDAIIYKKPDGKQEIQIPKSAVNSLKQTNSFKYDGQTYSNGSWHSLNASKGKFGTPIKWEFDKRKGFIKKKGN